LDHHLQCDTVSWFEIVAVVVTGVLHLLLRSHGANGIFIALAGVFWTLYIARYVRQDKTAWTRWGFRSDNLSRAFKRPTLLFVIASGAMAIYGVITGTLVWRWYMLLLLLLYPLWGILQQFLVQALVVANLINVVPRHGRTLAIIIGTILFGAVHYPYPWLMLATGGLACFFIPWYLRDCNLWPLGLYHGWLGTLFYVWVLGRDPWFEVFGKWLSS
jgi:hypothetical protein